MSSSEGKLFKVFFSFLKKATHGYRLTIGLSLILAVLYDQTTSPNLFEGFNIPILKQLLHLNPLLLCQLSFYFTLMCRDSYIHFSLSTR